MTETFDRFDYVLTMLANQLRKSETGLVFLLGAGCSCQYGLPNFKQLLIYIWEDCYGQPPEDSPMEVLRENLDKHWQALGPKRRRDLLRRSLRRVSGEVCPGYRRLARLCKPEQQMKIKAIVNMNFDSLLEDALRAECVDYEVVSSFAYCRALADKGKLIICKPHGSINAVKTKKEGAWITAQPELILDIANSELFTHIEEQTAAQKLLAGHDVVALGYSGVDSKIATSLRDMPASLLGEKDAEKSENFEARDHKLFFISPNTPDSRLFLAITGRASQNLTISGEEAAFENFMEQLDVRIHRNDDGSKPVADHTFYRSGDKFEDFTFMTRAERSALQKCLRLALRIRASINVADRSEVSIEEHGTSVYRSCLQLAEASGVCLSPPERYVLYAVAFLHDLGYFQAYSDGAAVEKGWQLLDGEHGQQTAALLDDWLPENDEKVLEIVPKTYGDRREVVDIIKFICRFHPSYEEGYIEAVLRREETAAKEKGGSYRDPRCISAIEIGGCKVPIQVTLLQALFASAEELATAHPWEPSADTLRPMEIEEDNRVIEDPVLDLYLRKKRNVVSFKVARGRVVGTAQPIESAKAKWLLAIVDKHLHYYEEVRARVYLGAQEAELAREIRDAKGEEWNSGREEKWKAEFREGCDEWRITFERRPDVKVDGRGKLGRELFEDLLRDALEEELEISLLEVRRDFARNLDMLRQYGEEALGEICSDLSRLELHEAVMQIRLVQRTLTLLILPDLWLLELKIYLGQVLNRIKHRREGESTISTGLNLWYKVQPLLMTLEPDDRLFLVRKNGAGWYAWEEETSAGREALRKIRKQLWRLGAVISYGVNDAQDGITKSFRDEIGAVLDMLGSILKFLKDRESVIVEELAKGSRFLLASSVALVESVEASERVRGAEAVKGKIRFILEKLNPLVSNLGVYFSGEIASVLDLIAIYSLSVDDVVDGKAAGRGRPAEAARRTEPRVRLATSKIVESALGAVGSANGNAKFFPHQGLLYTYLTIRRRHDLGGDEAGLNPMEDRFRSNFEAIIYPAWRFFAKKWHDGVEPVLMARICLDLGSSRFRSEVVGGLDYLMKRVEESHDQASGCGHNGCTLCTSRLLYIFAYSCKLFPGAESKKFAKKVGQLLSFMIARDDRDSRSPAWKGSDGSMGGQGIQSSDYLAWAARSVTFCFGVHEEIQSKTGISWLKDSCEIDVARCEKLLENRWAHLFEETSSDLLSRQGEEPHSFILGHVALALLDLGALSQSSPKLAKIEEEVPETFKDAFIKAYEDLGLESRKGRSQMGGPALLSRLYGWPAGILYGKYCKVDDERTENRRAMVELCLECIDSEIWIREGRDAGSWGYNIKNSQTIVTSLVSFWRHAFGEKEKGEYEKIFKEIDLAKKMA